VTGRPFCFVTPVKIRLPERSPERPYYRLMLVLHPHFPLFLSQFCPTLGILLRNGKWRKIKWLIHSNNTVFGMSGIKMRQGNGDGSRAAKRLLLRQLNMVNLRTLLNDV
jgi:hypothetical protein